MKRKRILSDKILLIAPFLITFIPFQSNQSKAGIEFQWDNNSGYRKLKWRQNTGSKKAKNKIYFFLRPSDRKTGFLKINVKVLLKLLLNLLSFVSKVFHSPYCRYLVL
mgnify:CR=1 FL=1